MAVGLAPTLANAILNSVFRNASFTPVSAIYMQLHVGDPGANGTANVATNTTRQQVTCGSNAAGGAISNTAAATWTGVSGAEDYTHFTLWDASTSGTFVWSGLMTANAVLVGDDFTVPIGDLDSSFIVAA